MAEAGSLSVANHQSQLARYVLTTRIACGLVGWQSSERATRNDECPSTSAGTLPIWASHWMSACGHVPRRFNERVSHLFRFVGFLLFLLSCGGGGITYSRSGESIRRSVVPLFRGRARSISAKHVSNIQQNCRSLLASSPDHQPWHSLSDQILAVPVRTKRIKTSLNSWNESFCIHTEE